MKHIYQKVSLLAVIALLSISATAQSIVLQQFATGFTDPVEIAHAGDSRLFVVEQYGIIKIVSSTGVVNSTPFLDINVPVYSGGNEQGLLGLAFHPDYATNGFFYVNYTKSDGATVISRFSVTGDPDVANPSSEQIILTIAQPYNNHNGGHIAFGPDGYLYIGMGDGGNGGDPDNYSQTGTELLGKMLRINVDAGNPYSVPADNPFVGNAGVSDEIWAIGVRNPWKFSFDRSNGDLWMGDVGQNAIEEINHVTSATGGENYGWRCYEGNATYNTSGCSPMSTMTFPVGQYNQGGSPYKCSITGGFVYRGTDYPNLQGKYFYADYCSSEIWVMDPSNGYTSVKHDGFSGNFVSFGENMDGELFISAITDGIIYQITDPSVGISEVENGVAYRIFPNPSSDQVSIQLEEEQIASIQLFDATGRLLVTQSNINAQLTTLNVDGFTGGIYHLVMVTDSGKKVHDQLIVD